jgi:hypothetical protein
VKIHRGHIMKKMGARSLGDLIRMAQTLGIHRTKQARCASSYLLTFPLNPHFAPLTP